MPETSTSPASRPRCANVVDGRPCNHPMSFHGGARHGACRALGCHCPAWVQPAEPKQPSLTA